MITRRPELFVEQSFERSIDENYAGPVFIWDVDKTYLDTHFDHIKGLLWIPFEFAVDKQPVEGAVSLLRALRHGIGETSALHPIFFVSASPVQLRSVLEHRMTLDGVQWDGLTLRDAWRMTWRGEIRTLLHPVAYKIAALLLYRLALPSACSLYLFGDDAESDPLIYTLFNTICSDYHHPTVMKQLKQSGVSERSMDALAPLITSVSDAGYASAHIFIRRVKHKPLPDDARMHGFDDFSEVRAWMDVHHITRPQQVAVDR